MLSCLKTLLQKTPSHFSLKCLSHIHLTKHQSPYSCFQYWIIDRSSLTHDFGKLQLFLSKSLFV